MRRKSLAKNPDGIESLVGEMMGVAAEHQWAEVSFITNKKILSGDDLAGIYSGGDEGFLRRYYSGSPIMYGGDDPGVQHDGRFFVISGTWWWYNQYDPIMENLEKRKRFLYWKTLDLVFSLATVRDLQFSRYGRLRFEAMERNVPLGSSLIELI